MINYGGLWANVTSEAIYFIGQTDTELELSNGTNVYEIRFPADAVPGSAVDAFWSLTLYSTPDYRVVPNELDRYDLNSENPLEANDDGSLSLWLATRLPEGVPQANWLPTPEGRGFSLNLRLYVAKPSVLDGPWFPAPLRRH